MLDLLNFIAVSVAFNLLFFFICFNQNGNKVKPAGNNLVFLFI